jgi:hypothetical protein
MNLKDENIILSLLFQTGSARGTMFEWWLLTMKGKLEPQIYKNSPWDYYSRADAVFRFRLYSCHSAAASSTAFSNSSDRCRSREMPS